MIRIMFRAVGPMVAATAVLTFAMPAPAQFRVIPAESGQPPAAATAPVAYADYAAIALDAPVVVDATIRGAQQIKGAQAVGLEPGFARFYVTADVAALIRGPAGLAPRLTWLVDLPLDPRGRAIKPRKGTRVLAFARPLADRAGAVQLIARDAQRPWSIDGERIVRAVLTEALAPDAPPVVTGVGRAFFVPGALPGEGETQIFLQTAAERPVSLSIVRNAAGERRWSVALSEVVDAAAPPPPRDTLLWYRLACALPASLPSGSVVADDPANMARARDDYAFVLQSLGPCGAPPRG